jgi:hypothetical protein
MYPALPIEFRRSRGKAAITALAGVAMAAVGYGLTHIDRKVSFVSAEIVQLVGWVALLFFGLCTLAAIYTLIFRPVELILSRDGVARGLFRRKRPIPWSEIADVTIQRIQKVELVALRRRDGRRTAYFDPKAYGLSPYEAVDMLRYYRGRNGGEFDSFAGRWN